MSLILLFSIGLGGIAVMQGAMNRQILSKWGVAPAIIMNNIVIFVAGLLLYLVVRYWPHMFPDNFRTVEEFSNFRWWYFVPGLLGLCLVGGIPVAMSKAGATKVFVAIIVGQILTSLVWDVFRESIPLSWPRVAGAVLAVVAVVLVNLEA